MNGVAENALLSEDCHTMIDSSLQYTPLLSSNMKMESFEDKLLASLNG
jgi:hypothetical protein